MVKKNAPDLIALSSPGLVVFVWEMTLPIRIALWKPRDAQDLKPK